MNLLRFLLVGALVSLTACTTNNPNYDMKKPHHTPEGFVNNYGPAGGKSLAELWRWSSEARAAGKPKPPEQLVKGYQGFERVKPNLALIQAALQDKSKVVVTWIAHATALLQVGGVNIITDPHFSGRASPVSFAGPERKVPLSTSLAELPRVDIVLISHNHYDHLDKATVKQLLAQPGGEPLFLVPLGIELWLKSEGARRVQKFDWWDSQEMLGLKLSFVPAQHWSSRSPFDRNASLWGGWVIEALGQAQGFKAWFAGDTGYSQDFVDIGKRFGGFDLSLIPVGAYEPRWFMKDQHVNPAEAVQIHKDVHSRFSVGIHWGSFDLTDESLDQPMIDLPVARQQAGVDEKAFVLFKHGETKSLR